MIVRVEACWCGHETFKYRADVRGRRLLVRAPDGCWTREVASEMLDLLEIELQIPRKRVRFQHR